MHKVINFKTLVYSILLLVFACNTIDNSSSAGENIERPNILWITCEDISPYLGCYGFDQAETPVLDELAKQGILFTHAYANAPVCAVARSTILSGMYATTIGTHQMRSSTQLPESIPAYPGILRSAGYYCTNNSKKDYNSNFENDTSLWDESGKTAHYRNRKPKQPFFAVFNNTVTHESQLSKERIQHYVENKLIPVNPRINPEDIKLPPYHPDLPEIRDDWARLHDLITMMDSMTGDFLQELEEDGLSENTIVFFYSDHGGQLSRSKRYIYNVGTQVPMIVYLPKKWRHLSKINPGGTDNELVSFVDLAKTVLSISRCPIPEKMQGRVFLGADTEVPPGYVHFYRDRMAERYDFSRAVTDGRYYFIRNFMPHRPRGRDTRYGYQVQANWRAWEDHYELGKCNEIQSQFYQPKHAVELFDTKTDPWHVNGISSLPGSHDKLELLSDELDQWMIETRDIGLIPEPMFYELAGDGKEYETMYDFAQSDDYPIKRILEAAKNASLGDKDRISDYLKYIKDDNPIIRYWGSYGLFLTRSTNIVIQDALKEMIANDDFAANRIMAAQALGICGDPGWAFEGIMKEAAETNQNYVLLQALNAFQYSKTDNRLTLEDWEKFKEKTFPENDKGAKFGYPMRIIDDAIALWPDRRKVY